MTSFASGRTRRVVTVTASLSAIATLAILFHASQPADGESRGWVGILVFAVWTVLPYAALVRLGARAGESVAANAIVLAGTILTCTAALVIYYQAFFVHLDPQSGLLFLFLPAYQLVAALVTWAVSRLPRGS